MIPLGEENADLVSYKSHHDNEWGEKMCMYIYIYHVHAFGKFQRVIHHFSGNFTRMYLFWRDGKKVLSQQLF